MSYWVGDFRIASTVRGMWNTNAIAGESITRATNGAVSVYKDSSLTQSTTGVTDTEDVDGLTGVHFVAIDTSADGTFYSAGSDFMVVLSAATIDGKTINAHLFSFSLENRSAIMPTTAGRKLDVSTGGEAGVDWANVGSPTTTLGLSGTTVATATAVTTVNGLAANTITATAIATDAITAAKIAADAIGASELAADAAVEIAGKVWDELTTGHRALGSFGQALQPVFQSAITAATGTTATLIGGSATDDRYTDYYVMVVDGTGMGQIRRVTAYVGSTGVLTVSPAWSPALDTANSILLIMPVRYEGTTTATDVWGAASRTITGGTVGTVGTGGITTGSFAAGAINAAAIATAAIDADAISGDAVIEIAGGVWDEARGGHTTSGTFGQGVASVQGAVTGAVASVTGAVGSVTGNVGGSMGSLASVAKADVKAEVVAVLTVDTIAELSQAIPATTPTFREAVMLLYMALRDGGTQSATTHTIKNDAGTVIAKATVSDDGTVLTIGKLVAGP